MLIVMRWVVVALMGLSGLVPFAARAQGGLRPADRRPELPPIAQPEEPDLVLPPVPEPDPSRLSQGPTLVVRAFAVEGSTVFSRAELEALTRPYTNRSITSEELQEVRDLITRHYVDRGYVSSGAVLPDQDPSDGVVILQVVEGRLAEIELRGLEGFREGYFRARLERAGRAPLALKALEAQLQRFQQDPRVARIDAVLAPTTRRGESRLVVTVEEAGRLMASAQFSNSQPTSVGELTGELSAGLGNAIGWSDFAEIYLRGTEGLREIEARYELPVTLWDTRLGLGYRHSEGDVVEDRFDPLDIESRSRTARIELRQPILTAPRRQASLTLAGEYRDSVSSVLGATFCFQEGVLDCTPSLAVLRLVGDALWRGRTDVVALRSTVSWGLDVLGATRSSSSRVPDGRFTAWLGQAQWVHLLPAWLLETQILSRLDVQLANDPLLSLEKIALGGAHSVRGYRENQIVRDNGIGGSLEARIPLWREPLGRPKLELVPFSDVGYGWNARSPWRREALVSLGTGIRISPWRWLHAAVYWGSPLVSAKRADSGLQRHGVHFEVRVDVP